MGYLCGDLRRHPFEPGSLDLIASIASLDHMDTSVAPAAHVEPATPRWVLSVGPARPVR
jgi:hypothetical protein